MMTPELQELAYVGESTVERQRATTDIDITQPHPLDHDIARLAYTYWLEGGCREGTAEEDWYRAEHDIRNRFGNDLDESWRSK